MISKNSKEFPITSELILFENDLIRFSDIDIKDGIIHFFLLINGEDFKEQNKETNKLILNKIGIKLRAVERTISIAKDVFLKITVRSLNKEQDEFYFKKKNSPKKIVEAPISFQDRIKLFSGGKSFSKTYRGLISKPNFSKSAKPSQEATIQQKNIQKEEKEDKSLPIKLEENINIKKIEVEENNKPENEEQIIEKKEEENINDSQPNPEENIAKEEIENKQESIEIKEVENQEQIIEQNVEEVQETIEDNQQNEETNPNQDQPENVEEQQVNIEEKEPLNQKEDEVQEQINIENEPLKVENNPQEVQKDINCDNQQQKSADNLVSNYEKNVPKDEDNKTKIGEKFNTVKNIVNLINKNLLGQNIKDPNKKDKKVVKKEIVEKKESKEQKIQIENNPVQNTQEAPIDITKKEEEKIEVNNAQEIESKNKKEEEIKNQDSSDSLKVEKIKSEETVQKKNIIEVPKENLQLEKSKTEKISKKGSLWDNDDLDEKEYFLEGTTYDKYLSKLASLKKKEYDSERESFCEGFFIASFPQKNGQVIENSQSFPSPCGHSECSILPAMKPEIIARYPLKDTKNLELNNLAATICFPTGIKVCYSEESPSMINDYVTPITNQKGERYYMITFHFYHKMVLEIYSKLYEMHPLKHHLMKFGDRFLDMSDEEMDEKVTNQIQESLEKSESFGFRDYVYVPYCICLISKYRYVSEMRKCVQSIYTMIINHLSNNKPDLNNLIMYLIHSVPIPERNTKVKFFVPFTNRGIELACPKVQDISVMNTNISTLLKYFSIDKLIIIFRLILFEKKILFIDDDYTRLSLVTDSFISLLYPFQWVHTYIPIMSDQMLKYLETFLPFLNGINSSLMNLVTEVFINNENEDNEEVFLVYINKDKFRLGSSLTSNKKKKYKYLQENVPALPAAMEKELKNKLKKIKDELDTLLKNQKDKKVDLTELDFRIRNVFIDMFVQMFHDYYKYMTFLDDDVVFNKNLFLEKITNNNDKHFYDEFIDTQLFQQFTQNIIKDELNYFTTMATKYDPNKKETLKRALPTKLNEEKLYVIKPEYLKIEGENSKEIEENMENKYQIGQTVKEDGTIDPQYRILEQLDKVKDEYYNNQNCYIYTLPETIEKEEKKQNESTNITKPEPTEYIDKENKIYKALQSLKLQSSKTFKRKGIGMTEKEKDNIKETIKDFTVKIFKSEEIEEDEKLKKELQYALNNPFGREFFVNMLSKNVTNIILLKEKSFHLLGTLIYNSLLNILNIEESNKIMEQMVILVKSTKYFGQEKKGATTTIWDVYKSRIQGYSKVTQLNFWTKWHELEIKKEADLTDLKREKIILEICDIMMNLELNKSFVKNVTYKLSENEFGKESEKYQSAIGLIIEKITHSKYISKAQ